MTTWRGRQITAADCGLDGSGEERALFESVMGDSHADRAERHGAEAAALRMHQKRGAAWSRTMRHRLGRLLEADGLLESAGPAPSCGAGKSTPQAVTLDAMKILEQHGPGFVGQLREALGRLLLVEGDDSPELTPLLEDLRRRGRANR